MSPRRTTEPLSPERWRHLAARGDPAVTSDDPLVALERVVTRAVRNSQYRVSVSPHAVLELFGKLRSLERALEVKERLTPVAHRHLRDNNTVFEHSHPHGDIPHGHHGSRYDNRPQVDL